ncbi:D-cysteine desulfhydrase [Novosphingobium album (ex Liu et al. 2023)]|uniref:D-cysteine desulfhydrase n=1 Tax=Novosphingobium album (ex Liu et al. 2023) TaxID=3031130 RepID=A0ABT5WR72_9SPHN|nr:D-cysteine desulfhydrase [Novosphingobium album (ex Liu et al. 2023)]MDE8652533.1 D-cysteine desulfhydrase [Novosphingobium album (ex Liu et al. 2023)]
MQLARFPRRRYTLSQTPIERMEHLSGHLGGAQLYVKRDDLLGLTSGGNKTRKLEFLVAEALKQRADTLITVGAVQSNHCRLTAAAAVREGLKCRLVLEQRVPGSYRADASGNNFLFDLLGVEKITVVNAGDDLNAAMEAERQALAAEGRTGYIIPGGGSNAIGSLGYAACAEEILQQGFDMGLEFDRVVVASGSGGTHAGLLVGFNANSAGLPITGINVRRPAAEQEANIHALTAQIADYAGVAAVPREAVVCRDEWVGPGYSLPTDEMVEAVRMFASLEGILLDPVYTGKAAAGLIGLIRAGEIGRDERVLFVHTGGSPALYAYQPILSGAAAAQ